MSDSGGKRNLGRGLSALLGAEASAVATSDAAQPRGEGGRAVRTAAVSSLHPSSLQPRRHFDADELKALAASMRESGVLQPLLVRPRAGAGNEYEIVAGERRWRAAQQAGLHEVPVLVREIADREALELALVENVQRQDLNALEEAEGYRRLTEEFGHTQEELAKRVGKSRSHVANLMRRASTSAKPSSLPPRRRRRPRPGAKRRRRRTPTQRHWNAISPDASG
jgi:ParB family chromosome partitioning protein